MYEQMNKQKNKIKTSIKEGGWETKHSKKLRKIF